MKAKFIFENINMLKGKSDDELQFGNDKYPPSFWKNLVKHLDGNISRYDYDEKHSVRRVGFHFEYIDNRFNEEFYAEISFHWGDRDPGTSEDRPSVYLSIESLGDEINKDLGIQPILDDPKELASKFYPEFQNMINEWYDEYGDEDDDY